MEQIKNQNEQEFPFPVSSYRFDQKNEMFKRAIWDEKMLPFGERFYMEAKYGDEIGYTKKDISYYHAAWNLEWSAAFGIFQSNAGLYAWEGVNDNIKHWVETGDPVKEAPEEMSQTIKKVASSYGADLVGICRLSPNWVYSHEYNMIDNEHYPIEVPEGCHNAIVIGIEMDYEIIRTSPTAIASGAVGLGYSKMAFLANLLATFIRHMGYRAIPCGNDTALSIPLAMAAGLGEAGRLGLLITKKFGPRVRLCKVFTDLPLEYDSYEPFGVEEFCKACKKCAQHCPSRAITRDDMTTEGYNISNQSGVLKWYVDCEKCFQWWAKQRMDCSNCIRACPFNKPPGKIHDFSRSLIRKENPLLNRFLIWIDDLLGYGKPLAPERFWDER